VQARSLVAVTRVESVRATAYQIPTDRPEADGTLAWDSTTIVIVEANADSGETGLGYTYSSKAAAEFVAEKLAKAVQGTEVDAVGAAWRQMVHDSRNAGRPGIAACAISAVDVALWDLKARVLGVPLHRLLGAFRDRVPLYGSGGFTTYTEAQLHDQLRGWVRQGILRVKIKIGREEPLAWARAAREAIGPDIALFVDANGAFSPKEAIELARELKAEAGVVYFEEPVTSDQPEQLAFVRAHAPVDVAAGEYGYDPWYSHRLLTAGAVDVLQADATRCLGITGWLQAAALAHAFAIPFSGHTAPAIHAHCGCAAPELAHLEYFHDHVRIEGMLFEGTLEPEDGCLRPDPERPGLGLKLRDSALAEVPAG
jgi:L-alanine-DL-glutamate epimerase-like enolase superfamily enzyme